MTIADNTLQDIADAAAALDKRGDRQMAARLMRLHRRLSAPDNAEGESRSVMRRVAVQKGEDAPRFDSRAQSAEAVCSCPSGDGSLRWPCAKHPPVDANVAHGTEALRAEVERLNTKLSRLEVIAGYGGVSSDAPERLILASEVYDGVQSCDKWCDVRRALRLADDAAESVICTEGHNTEGRQWVLYTEHIAADPYLEDCIAHLEWRGIARRFDAESGVTVIFEEQA